MPWITDTKELISEFGKTSIRKAVQNSSLEELLELVEENPESFRVYASDVGIEYAVETFEDAFEGAWASEREYAEYLFDELYLHEIPDHLQRYIDYDAFARDLFIGDYVYIDGYVFRRM